MEPTTEALCILKLIIIFVNTLHVYSKKKQRKWSRLAILIWAKEIIVVAMCSANVFSQLVRAIECLSAVISRTIEILAFML
jgi:hypothetical protein